MKIEKIQYLKNRSNVIFAQQIEQVYKLTANAFIILMAAQWVGGILISLWLTPEIWNGSERSIHPLLMEAVLLGLLIASLPMYLSWKEPAKKRTRHLVGASQMIWSALFIHLSGGRIESHFHIFGSLAFLAFYRDWKVIVSAASVVVAEHVIRAIAVPGSIFEEGNPDIFQIIEHGGWVVFESLFLVLSCKNSIQMLRASSAQQAALEWNSKVINRSMEEERVLREDLEEAVSRAEAASAAKSAFLASMSHEIRTPLNGIKASVHLVQKGKLEPMHKKFLQIAEKSCDHLGALLNDILDLSKIEAGKMELNLESFNLRKMVEQVIDTQIAKASEKGLILTNCIAADAPQFLMTDKTLLSQVLQNLISNAIKFTATGHVIVEVGYTRESSDSGKIKFEIKDTGIGVPIESQAKLFQTFTQADSSTTKKYGGSGLGLAISKKITTLLGGDIGIISEAGVGSNFWFTATVSTTKGQQTDNKNFSIDHSQHTILLVGWNDGYVNIIRKQLANWKFNLDRATDITSLTGYLKETSELNRALSVIFILPDQISEYIGHVKQNGLALEVPVAIVAGSMQQAEEAETMLNQGGIKRVIFPVSQSKIYDELMSLLYTDLLHNNTENVEDLSVLQNVVADYGGARVLIADDNEINRIVLFELLKEFKITPKVVVNGKEALEEAQKENFDIVFMDCHMPVMDGLEAANEIRKFEMSNRDRRKATTIVALTADVTVETRKKVEEAGMKHYLSKPLDPKELAKLLGKIVSGSGQSPRIPDIESANGRIDLAPIDLAALAERFMKNEKLVKMILDKFEQQLTADLETISKTILLCDPKLLFEQCHALKGAASAAGAMEVRKYAEMLENAGRSGELTQVSSIFSDLTRSASSCLNFLKEYNTHAAQIHD